MSNPLSYWQKPDVRENCISNLADTFNLAQLATQWQVADHEADELGLQLRRKELYEPIEEYHATELEAMDLIHGPGDYLVDDRPYLRRLVAQAIYDLNVSIVAIKAVLDQEK